MNEEIVDPAPGCPISMPHRTTQVKAQLLYRGKVAVAARAELGERVQKRCRSTATRPLKKLDYPTSHEKKCFGTGSKLLCAAGCVPQLFQYIHHGISYVFVKNPGQEIMNSHFLKCCRVLYTWYTTLAGKYCPTLDSHVDMKRSLHSRPHSHTIQPLGGPKHWDVGRTIACLWNGSTSHLNAHTRGLMPPILGTSIPSRHVETFRSVSS